MRRSAIIFALASAWLVGAGVVEVQGQPPGGIRRTSGGAGTTVSSTQLSQAINPAVLLPDLVGDLSSYIIAESYTEENPCTPHTHDITRLLSVKNPTTRPAAGSIQVRLLRQGTLVGQPWTIPAPGPGAQDRIGRFQYVLVHDCPGGGNTISVGPTPTPNYQLEVDTTNAVQERDENNVYGFYMDPAVAFQPE